MVRCLKKLLVTVAVSVPVITFGMSSGPVGAIPPSNVACFGTEAQLGRVAAKGDVAIVNLTPVLASASGDGQLVALELQKNPPKAANVNFGPNTVDPNVAFTRTGDKGSMCFVNSKHADVDLIADHLGTIKGRYFQFAQPNGAPKRVTDTRDTTIIKPREARCFKVAGKPGDAAVVNLTPVKATGAGDGQLVSSNIKNKPPKAANVNFARGTIDPNVAIAKIGNDNKVCFINSKHASVHLVADHLGTIKANVYRSAQKNGAPKRVLNTTSGKIIPPNGKRCFTVAGEVGDGAIVNLTPIKATAGGNGQLISSDVVNDPPKAANVNFAPGTVDPNIAVAEIGIDHKVCFVNSQQASVHVIADHLGSVARSAYSSAEFDGEARRIADTRILAEVTPVSSTGPRPLRPSGLFIACGYDEYSWERRILLRGIEGDGSKSIVLRFKNDPWPTEGDGNDHVMRTSLGPISSGIDFTSFVPVTGAQARTWNARIEIETFTNIPALSSKAVFDIRTDCMNGRVPVDIPGRAFPAENSSVVQVLSDEDAG